METSPVIPDKIITLFKDSFKKSDNYLKIIKPEICDVLISTDNYRNHGIMKKIPIKGFKK